MGTEKKPAKTKQRQSSSNSAYYSTQMGVTAANKALRAARRARWLAGRQSALCRARMSHAWSLKHPVSDSKPMIQVRRYDSLLLTNPKFLKEESNA